MKQTVIFNQLSAKYIEKKDSAPADVKQVVYYSLATGHHLGIIDCLQARLQCPAEAYRDWIATLQAGTPAWHKMDGVMRFGEIIIDQSHVSLLAQAFDAALPYQSEEQQRWSRALLNLLQAIQEEPVIYLIVRRQYD